MHLLSPYTFVLQIPFSFSVLIFVLGFKSDRPRYGPRSGHNRLQIEQHCLAKTYNLSSYKSIEELLKLSFEVWDLSAVESDGLITILKSVKVPGKPDKLNQVRQVSPSVTNRRPDKHNFTLANLNTKSTLYVSTSTFVGENTTNSTDKNGGISATDNRFGLGLFAGVLMLVASCVNF
ncbi:hypothetical protein K1719_038964 [Acacia pycnantha]|nr:hypothetical protein K1719_038964 [Acacia pycnantha]